MRTEKLLYLHIGLHKTATTTIQAGLKLNIEKLLEDGYCYPRSGLIGDAQHNLVWEVAQGDVLPWDFVAERTRFNAEHGGFGALVSELRESPAERIIISSEAFENLSPKRILELKNRLKDYDVRIVVFLRNQSEYYQSAWAQQIKFGLTTDGFSTWIEKTLASPDDYLASFGNYKTLLKNWAHVFGRENIIVEIFKNKQSSSKHIFFRFLDLCGISNHVGYKLPKDHNISPGIKSIELMRQVNKILDSNQKLPAYFYSSIMNFNKRHSWDDTRLSILTQDLSDKIHAFYSESNKSVALDYFGKEGLFEEKIIRGFNKFNVNQLSSLELLQIVTETFFGVITSLEEELHEYYRHVIANVEQELETSQQKLLMNEQELETSQQKLLMNEQELIDTKLGVVLLQEKFNNLETRSLKAVNELSGMRGSRVFRLIERIGKSDLLSLLNPAFQQLLDDSYIFQNVKGFLLQPSVNLQKVEYLGYRLEFDRPGLCGIWIAPLLDIPLQKGVVGVEFVSPENKIVLQQVLSVSDLKEDMPGYFIFEPVLDTQQGIWEIRIFARDVEGPIRLAEWRKYSWGGLGRLKACAFFGFEFLKHDHNIK